MSALFLLALTLPAARAETRCDGVDGFNAWTASHGGVTDVQLRFDVTGVVPSDYFNTKGGLANLDDSTCAVGAGLALKVYGTAEPANDSHPPGTLKLEFGDGCSTLSDEGETWADPNPSETVFSTGAERCDVEVWLDPATFGYRLSCDTGTWDAVGDNIYGTSVDGISLLSLIDGSTWRMDNATTTWNEVCWEVEDGGGDTGGGDGGSGDGGGDGGTTGGTLELGAVADVTASQYTPDAVYGDVSDLSVEHGDSEVYLRFDLSSVPGRITSAALVLTASSDGSAEGSGGDAWAVSDDTWSEDSLTWNNRPAAGGSALSRVAPVSVGQVCTWDVSAAVSAAEPVSFAILPQATDTNGSHFLSKEASAGSGPRLVVTWTEDGGGGDGGGTGGDGGGGSDGGSTGGDGGDGPGDEGLGEDTGGAAAAGATMGCACAGGGPARAGLVGALLLGLAAGVRRRRG